MGGVLLRFDITRLGVEREPRLFERLRLR